jgi:hypothetical protein
LGYTEIGYAAAAYDGTGGIAALKIKTPAADQDITADQVTRGAGGASVSITGTKQGYTYELADPGTGAVIASKTAGANGETIEFTNLDAAKTYQAVAKPPSGNHMAGVRVYPYPGALAVDY